MAARTGTAIRHGGARNQADDALPHFIAHLVRAAVAAPSMLGSQAWRFRYRTADRTIELRAHPGGALRYRDPDGRSVYIGCGAALFNLRLAAAWMGREPVVRLLPSPDAPLLLATVRLGGAHRPTTSERELHAAIPRRHTSRQPFANRAVPGTVLAELAEAARIEGAVLHLLYPGETQRALRLAADAEGALLAGPQDRAELAEWAGVEREPRVAVLSTQFRARADWLRAGQALQRVLLLATVRGVSARLLRQPLAVRDAWLTRDPRAGIGQPQLVLRLGYGQIVPSAPRRSIPGGADVPKKGGPAGRPHHLRDRR